MFSLMGKKTGLYITITDCLSGLSEKLLKWLPLVHPITEEITEYATNARTVMSSQYTMESIISDWLASS